MHPTDNAGVMYLEVLPGAAWGGLDAFLPETTRRQVVSGTLFSPESSDRYSLWPSSLLGEEKLIFLVFRFSVPESHLTKGVLSNFWM